MSISSTTSKSGRNVRVFTDKSLLGDSVAEFIISLANEVAK
jgi:hypothetical protein